MKNYCLAIDIGASGGRHIVGYKDNGRILTDEVYRFPNAVDHSPFGAVWDTERLFSCVVEGIRLAFLKYPRIRSLAIDTWGVDYVLMKGDKALCPCRAYREPGTEKAIKAVHARVPFETLYARTGIQFQPFNTIYQLSRDALNGLTTEATDFLMLPEYLAYRLTGRKLKEYTNATTTGLVNAGSGKFDKEIIKELDFLPEKLFGELSVAGERVGRLLPEIVAAVGRDAEVVLCPTHDTASAVEAVEGDGPYISSGTWSLLGIKSDRALTDRKSMESNWSNEGGVGYIRYQKNIMGMWLVQSLRKELCPDVGYAEIAAMAEQSSFAGVADVYDEKFLAPRSMREALASSFGKGAAPETEKDFFRAAYNSLAAGYAKGLKELRENTGKNYDEITIVGGGAKNAFLNALTASACSVKVNALPIEATAAGNLKTQIARCENE